MVTNGEVRRRGAVGRPKRYRYHQDRGGALRHDMKERLRAWLDAEASPQVQADFAERSGLTGPMPYYPLVPITFNDPRVCEIVVDYCLMTDVQTYVRAIHACNHLKGAYPQWYWDVSVMGRVLAGIRSACEEDYRNANSWVEDPGDIPFAMGRDGMGRFYVIDPLGGNEGRLWLWALRGVLHKLAAQQQFADLMGEFKAHHAHDVNAGWLSEVSPGPIRTKDAYEGQLRQYSGADVEPGALRPLPSAPDIVALRDRFLRESVPDVVGRPAGE